VIAVNLGVTQADDAVLESLKGLSTLKKLTLNGTKISDAGLDHLRNWARCRSSTWWTRTSATPAWRSSRS
jgi:hypothetical protein